MSAAKGKDCVNRCKICGYTVTGRSGLQCQGKCRQWTHFTCLNYDDDKIDDILEGNIVVLCPCRNCCMANDDGDDGCKNINERCPAVKKDKKKKYGPVLCASPDLKKRKKECPSKKPTFKSNSCVCAAPVAMKNSTDDDSSSCCSFSSDASCPQEANLSIINALENVRDTVGLLSSQVRGVMCRIINKIRNEK